MSREIKFRFWNKQDCIMVDWLTVRQTAFNRRELQLCYSVFGTDPNIVKMQFTGLMDKNGKEIYEGDILRGPNGKPWIVVWQRCGWWVATERVEPKRWQFARDEQYHILDFIHFLKTELPTIVGNRFEHPELLKP